MILIIVLISLVVVLMLGVSIGWGLTLLLPFTLFEGSVLGLITIAIVVLLWHSLVRSSRSSPRPELLDEETEQDFAAFEENNYDTIPASRFYQSWPDKTWESWIRYQIANGIYVEFQDSPKPVAPMGNKQLQELAIRLADITVTLLKSKTPNAKKLKVSMTNLRQEMNKMGQRPYDDDILKLATVAINEDLDYHYQDIMTVIRVNLWDKPCDLLDWQQ